jgi:hypothetical protein
MKTLLMQGAKAMNIALNDVQATSLISYLELIIKSACLTDGFRTMVAKFLYDFT